MLSLTIRKQLLYNEKENRFYDVPNDISIELEHSLLAISKWESKWHVPFLKKEDKTREQVMDYIKCMCITPDVPDSAFYGLSNLQIQKISDYINDPMTATTISNTQGSGSRRSEIVTSELVYYWMNECNIDKECETWHLNRLLRLIEVTSIKRQPDKKMTRRQTGTQNKALNAVRRAKMGSRG